MKILDAAIPRPYVRVFVLRTVLLWTALHVLTFSFTFTYRATLLGLAFTVFVILVDAERRNERRFLANLGVSRAAIALTVLVTASCLEIILVLIPQPLKDGLQRIMGGMIGG